ncbi:MAG: hypothetical protein FVQ79_14270 [Planctomycetes bacterium]|nr:hypothetical protein [Planctomycetota bacterium]
MINECIGQRVDGGGEVKGVYCVVDGKHYILEGSAQVADEGPRGIEVAGFVEVYAGSVVKVDGLIKLLHEIVASRDGFTFGFPEIIDKKEMQALCSEGYTKQESDIPSLEYEYVSQFAGIGGGDFSGFMVYPYKDIFLKVWFSR